MPPSTILSQKVILLTGGADGIGWECAKAYARAGAHVIIADISAGGQEKLAELEGDYHSYFVTDLTSEQSVKELFSAIEKRYERLDAIHNNAGLAHPSLALHETTETEWDKLMSVNLKAIFWTTKYGINLLKVSRGCILHTSSLVGEIGQHNHAAYVATKGAVNALTKAMALDYAAFGIRVNAIAPAAVNTPMLRAWSLEQENSPAIREYLDKLHPLGKMPDGDVIADAATFLLSDAARFITGCILPVSGGAELGYRFTN
ncbi:SDR family NAD(P)-dependent oxidoreductase [Flavihumibacter petaseus]|nr:SDR family oxidoreductase [Flavihumibacter petaseus]